MQKTGSSCHLAFATNPVQSNFTKKMKNIMETYILVPNHSKVCSFSEKEKKFKISLKLLLLGFSFLNKVNLFKST